MIAEIPEGAGFGNPGMGAIMRKRVNVEEAENHAATELSKGQSGGLG